ncbi:hypothetical protein cypCar_00043441 [Cyprinus carpio]|nr:hypothetical protein cypCar_00043441 [Cyprinus carpio]
MFHGPACEESIQNIIDYAALEGEINGMIYKPVPDLTTIYLSIKELKDYTKEIVESVRHNIQWTQIFVKYSNVIQKFRYINTLHLQLRNGTITQHHYISKVGAQFTGGHSFQFYLKEFDHMMMGTGFGDKHNILDIFRKSLVQDSQRQSAEPVVCSKYYTDQIDYFVRYMFALEKEAVLAWSKYLLVTGKSENFVEKVFKDYVSRQWRLFNKNGCGPLKAADLQNNHCKEQYHSTAQQQVLVDPCGGSGWKWMEGEQQNMVSYDESKRFPGVKYYVCSGKSDDLVGKLFNTRQGFMCHIAKDNTRDGSFYALVPQPCI